VESNSEYHLYEGNFISPFVRYMGDMLPQECHKATFQMVVPVKWKHEKHRPVCIHLAGTGDHVSFHYFPNSANLLHSPHSPTYGTVQLEAVFE
jgi:hypothetical protein